MANDVFQVIVGGILAGQPVENVLHYTNSAQAANPIGESVSLNDAWEASVLPQWLDCLPDNYFILGTKTKQINNGGGPTSGKLQPAGTTGNRGSAADTSAVGPVLLTPYQKGARWFTGRIFMPGVGEDDIANNQFSAALLTELADLIAILIGPIVFGGGSSFTYGIYLPVTNEFRDASAMGVSVKPGLQNRRLMPHF